MLRYAVLGLFLLVFAMPFYLGLLYVPAGCLITARFWDSVCMRWYGGFRDGVVEI